MKNKKLIIISVILAVIIAVISIFAIRYSRKNSDNESSLNKSTTTELVTEESTEDIAEENTTEVTESETEKVTEETETTTTEKVTKNNIENTTEKIKETTTRKPETTTKAPVRETTTKAPETTTAAPITIFTADLNTSSPTALELALFDAINAEREKAGIAKLKWNDNLHFFARKRAEEVIITKGHTRPDGTKFYTIFDEYGVTNTRTAENLAYGRKESPTLVNAYVEAWMNSDGHRGAILNPENKYAAMGVATDSNGTVYAVTLFHK